MFCTVPILITHPRLSFSYLYKLLFAAATVLSREEHEEYTSEEAFPSCSGDGKTSGAKALLAA